MNFDDPYDCAVMIDCGFKLQYPKEEWKKALGDFTRQQKADVESDKIRRNIL